MLVFTFENVSKPDVRADIICVRMSSYLRDVSPLEASSAITTPSTLWARLILAVVTAVTLVSS